MDHKQTQDSIKATATNLIKKHKNMIVRHGGFGIDELAMRHAIVSVNQIRSIVSTDWGIWYWSEVRKQIKDKLKRKING